MEKKYLFLITFIILLSLSTVSAKEDNNYTSQLANTEIPFVENQGQIDTDVKYYAQTFYGTVYITTDSITHSIRGDNNTSMAITEQFLDVNGRPISFQPTGMEKNQAKVDYYIGNSPDKWQTGLETWTTISLGELYPGIEVLLRAYGANVEKIFIIDPGTEPENIQVQVQGSEQLTVNNSGSLDMCTAIGVIQLRKPVAFQMDEEVTAYYQLENNIYSFHIPFYDKNQKLIIDPTLEYSTYLGGTEFDIPQGMVVDATGNIYITGYTISEDYPTTPGAFKTTKTGEENVDAFISKLAPTGMGTYQLLYSTFVGGSDKDQGYAIAVDSGGRIYITGTTFSFDYPVTIGAFQTSLNIGPIEAFDAFMTILAPNKHGSNDLVYSTYIGGTLYDEGLGIALDGNGLVYITGGTSSKDYPTTPGAYQSIAPEGFQNGFISVLSPQGQEKKDLIYSTYLGGTNYNSGFGIVLDKSGNIYVTGKTESKDFPTTKWAYQTTYAGNGDAFISVISPKGQEKKDLIYSTYLGGTGSDISKAITIDKYGNIYITGNTDSKDFPITKGAYQTSLNGSDDVFISKFILKGQGKKDLIYSTYLGGSSSDAGVGIAVDKNGNIYITGQTDSKDYPTTRGSFQTRYAGSIDAFISIVSPQGHGRSDLLYSSYIGGGGMDVGVGIITDASGNIYVMGSTNSNNFPTTKGALQKVRAGEEDLFIMRFAAGLSDLTITKTVDNHTPYVGDKVTYTITVYNKGPDAAFGVRASEVLPAALRYLSSKANYGSYNPATGIWCIDYLPKGAVAILTLTCRVLKSGYITNTAQVRALTPDPGRDNKTARVTIHAFNRPVPHGRTVPMQKTGTPLAILLLALFMVAGGIVSTKK